MFYSILDRVRRKEIDIGINEIFKQRNRRHPINGKETRSLSHQNLITSWEIDYLMKSIGFKLTSDEFKALKEEFQERGGFSKEEVYEIALKSYTKQNLSVSFENALLYLSKDKKTVYLKDLYTSLFKSGLLVNLSIIECETFCKLCLIYDKNFDNLQPDTKINIKSIVDALFRDN